MLKALGDGASRGETVALLGLTFKPNTDDMRDAPAIALAMAKDAGVPIRAFDPEGMEVVKATVPDLVFAHDAYDAVTGADSGCGGDRHGVGCVPFA